MTYADCSPIVPLGIIEDSVNPYTGNATNGPEKLGHAHAIAASKL